MISNPILDIIISLAFIFSMLSILVSILNEWASHYFNRRAKLLKNSIAKLLNDSNNLDYGALFFTHLTIETICKIKPNSWYNVFAIKMPPKKILPQYISASMFADVVIDIIAAQARHTQKLVPKRDAANNALVDANGLKIFEPQGDAPPTTLKERFIAAVKQMNPSPFNDMLQGYIDRAEGDMDKIKTMIENWFNDYMDRVSGWYKVSQRRKLLLMGFLVAVLLNVDSLHLVKTLSLDTKLREKLVAQAEIVADNYQNMSDSLRQDISSQITLFKQANDSIAKTEEVRTLDSMVIVNQPKLLTSLLNKKYASRYKEFTQMLLTEDSLSQVYLDQTDDVLGIVAALNLPIGYSADVAPMSWLKKNIAKKPVKKNDGILKYNSERNTFSWSNLFRYLVGVFISSFSLSFGAPFWFDLLVKFVNIRRSGIKPVTNRLNAPNPKTSKNL